MSSAQRKKPRLPPPLEHVEQSLFFQRVDLDPRTRDRCIFAIPNGGHRHKAVAGKLKAEGVKHGVPDVFVAEPAPSFYGLFIEFKRWGEQPSSTQRLWHGRLRLRGYSVRVCYSWEEAWTVLLDYLGFTGE